jgi:hypothetical protein
MGFDFVIEAGGPAPLQATQASAFDNLKQPARKRRDRPQGAEPPVEDQERVLNGFLDVLGGAVAARVAAQVGLADFEKPQQRLFVTLSCGFDKLLRSHFRAYSACDWSALLFAAMRRPAKAHIGQKPTAEVKAMMTPPIPQV